MSDAAAHAEQYADALADVPAHRRVVDLGSGGGLPALVLGWLRPVMVVPREFTGWSDERVRAVLLHELAHLKRNDWPVLVLPNGNLIVLDPKSNVRRVLPTAPSLRAMIVGVSAEHANPNNEGTKYRWCS